MAMAHNAPNPPGRTKRGITNHALTRLRERSDAAGHMDDPVARKVLDEALDRAMSDPEGRYVEEVLDERGQVAKLVDLSETSDGLLLSGDVFSLVKADHREPTRELVVTILGSKMAERIRRETRELAEAPFNPALAGLGSVRIVPPVESNDEDRPQSPPVATEAVEAPEAGDYAVALGDRLEQDLTRAQAIERVREATERGVFSGVRLYRRIAMKVKVDVEVRDE